MSITVGQIYSWFPQFNPEDMVKLAGANCNGRTQVSLSKIASYNGSYAAELSKHTANEEGDKFVNMLSNSKKANIDIFPNDDKMVQKNGTYNQIPMDVSIFNIKRGLA